MIGKIVDEAERFIDAVSKKMEKVVVDKIPLTDTLFVVFVSLFVLVVIASVSQKQKSDRTIAYTPTTYTPTTYTPTTYTPTTFITTDSDPIISPHTDIGTLGDWKLSTSSANEGGFLIYQARKIAKTTTRPPKSKALFFLSCIYNNEGLALWTPMANLNTLIQPAPHDPNRTYVSLMRLGADGLGQGTRELWQVTENRGATYLGGVNGEGRSFIQDLIGWDQIVISVTGQNGYSSTAAWDIRDLVSVLRTFPVVCQRSLK